MVNKRIIRNEYPSEKSCFIPNDKKKANVKTAINTHTSDLFVFFLFIVIVVSKATFV